MLDQRNSLISSFFDKIIMACFAQKCCNIMLINPYKSSILGQMLKLSTIMQNVQKSGMSVKCVLRVSRSSPSKCVQICKM